MRYVYPCDIVFDEEGPMELGGGEVVNLTAGYSVTFPDVPEAITGGWSWEEALEMAEDCISVALGMYVRADEDLPVPGRARDGQVLVPVPLLVAAKLTLYTAMREQGLTRDDLAAKLGTSVDSARKLVDPRYRSHVSQIESALRVVGRALIVEDCDAVPQVERERALTEKVHS